MLKHIYKTRLFYLDPVYTVQIRVVTTSSSVTLRSYLLSPLPLLLVVVKFCNIIINLRAPLFSKVFEIDIVILRIRYRVNGVLEFWNNSHPNQQNYQQNS